MAIYNRAFSLLSKGFGKANGFALSHIFPALKTDYMALRRGVIGSHRSMMTGGGIGGGIQGLGTGFARGHGWNRGTSISTRALTGARYGAYGAAGMWALGD